MKPARFIFNSDYVTSRITGEKKLEIVIPNDFTAPVSPSGDYYTIGVTSTTLPNDTDTFSIYVSSSRYNYISPGGDFGYTLPEGSVSHSDIYGDSHQDIYLGVEITGNTATFKAYTLNPYPAGGLRFTGYGQTVTAHILTFKDPFSA